MKPRTKLATGERFGRLTVVGQPFRERREGATQTRTYAWCRCDCGNERLVAASDLKTGNTGSCGCYARENTSKVNGTHRESKSRLHVAWCSMKARCYNPNVTGYKHWGRRGISVCDEWRDDYSNFARWARANGYAENLTIDRIDNDGNYEPSNCRWITQKEQSNNTSKNRPISAFGETKNLKQWTEDPRCEADHTTLFCRLANHWHPEDAISTPIWGRPQLAAKARANLAETTSVIHEGEIAHETWAAIPDWPAYEFSDIGRVRSYWKQSGSGRGKSEATKARKFIGDTPKLLKPYRKKAGQVVVNLFPVEGKPKTMLVARLVLTAHVGPPPDNAQACHYPDPNPANCRLSNLRWGSPSENNRDKSRVNKLILEMIDD